MKLKKFLVAVLVLLTSGTAMAQEMPAIPQDPNVKIGHLDNGLTYYLRHNANPAGKADFYVAQKVGSLQEEESQRGLAHLLEHLAFNGSEHFKDDALTKFIESKGAYKNATTNIDRTWYFFTDMPTTDPLVVDSCMLILKDWCNGITLDQKAIDDERDVVHNEYRRSMNGSSRLYEKALPTLCPGSKYGSRLPIGLMSVVDGCTPEVLRAYYKKWYRPDNQAIVIVGDIDVDKIEAKIKELFSGIKVAADAAKVIDEPIPDTKDAIYVVDKDKEQQVDRIIVYMKHDAPTVEEKQSLGYMVQDYVTSMIGHMLSVRLLEKSQEPDCPFLAAGAYDTRYCGGKTKYAFDLEIVSKPGMSIEAYIVGLTEAKRVADFGFTATELVRAKDEYMSQLESAYNNRDKMKNGEFPKLYVENFESGEPIPSVEQRYMIMQQIAPAISVEMINQAAKEFISLRDSNFVTFGMLNEKEGATYPTVQQFADAKAKVIATPVEAYVDNVKQEPLISEAPKAGKVVKTSENKTLGYKELKLSNGARVILKKTDYKDNEIKMYAFAKGGFSSLPKSDAVMVQAFTGIVESCGLGNFSSTDIQKALAGKQVGVTMAIDDYSRSINGTSTPKDIETFMQLLYLKMTNLTKDEKAFENLRQQFITILSNADSNPELIYADSVAKVVDCNNPFSRIPTIESIKGINIDEIVSNIRGLYGNAKDFTFVFVGNFDEQTFLPLINTYIASLPNNGKTLKDVETPRFKGEVSNIFDRAMANPNSHDTQNWSAAYGNVDLRNRVICKLAGNMLYLNYYRVIREKLSATYTPNAYCTVEYTVDGKPIYNLTSDIMLNPDKTDMALPCIKQGIDELASNPNAEDLAKSKETFINYDTTGKTTNEYWIDGISDYLRHGLDKITGYQDMVNSIQIQDIKDFVNNVILKSGNHAHILMKAVKE